MVYLVIFLLSVGSLMVAAPESKNEKGMAVEGVQPKELTQVVVNGAVKPVEKNVDEQKQAPITTLFFSKKTLSNMDFDELKTEILSFTNAPLRRGPWSVYSFFKLDLEKMEETG